MVGIDKYKAPLAAPGSLSCGATQGMRAGRAVRAAGSSSSSRCRKQHLGNMYITRAVGEHEYRKMKFDGCSYYYWWTVTVTPTVTMVQANRHVCSTQKPNQPPINLNDGRQSKEGLKQRDDQVLQQLRKKPHRPWPARYPGDQGAD